jgi:protein TonB
LGLLVRATTAFGQSEEPVRLPPVEVTAPHPIRPPRLREVTQPPYPEAARRQGVEGTVILLVKVLADGRAGEVKVKGSSGSAFLDDAALTAARGWKFVPAMRGPVPVEAWVEVPVKFELTVPK